MAVDPGTRLRARADEDARMEQFLRALGTPAANPRMRGIAMAPAPTPMSVQRPGEPGVGAWGVPSTQGPGQPAATSVAMGLPSASASTGFGGDINAMALQAIEDARIASGASGTMDPGQRLRRTEIGNLAASAAGAQFDPGQRSLLPKPTDMAGSMGGPGGRGGPTRDEVLAWLGTEGAQNLLGLGGGDDLGGGIDPVVVTEGGTDPVVVTDGDKPLVCEPGEHLENGVCVPDTVTTTQCEPGFHLENGQCVPDAAEAQVEDCPVGQVRNAAGQCVPIADTTPADACEAGQVRDANGNCVWVQVPSGVPGPDGEPGPIGERVETGAQTQINIVDKTLQDTQSAIAEMVASGLIDIQTGHDLYNTETERVWKDFLSTQSAVRGDFSDVADAQQTQRYEDRTALEDQLRAAGVDPGLVGDRLGMIDAVAGAGAAERGGYLDDMAMVSQMANADRKFMGEGIFGGYRQDLQSRGRELGYGAEVDAIGGRQTAREQAFQAADLAPFLGLDPRAVAAGLASGVDVPGLSTAISEASLDRALTARESELGRTAQGIDPDTGRPYGFSTTTGLTAGEQAAAGRFTAGLTAQGVDTGPGGTGRLIGFDEATGLTAGERLSQENVLLGLAGQGMDMRETIQTPQGPIANPAYGRPYGFDPQTGLTAAEKAVGDRFGEQITSTEKMAADRITSAELIADTGVTSAEGMAADRIKSAEEIAANRTALDWWEARQDQAGGVLDRALDNARQQLLEDKFDWEQTEAILDAMPGQEEWSLHEALITNLSGTAEGPEVLQDIANVMFNYGITSMNDKNVAWALVQSGRGDLLNLLYATRGVEAGFSESDSGALADAAVDAAADVNVGTGTTEMGPPTAGTEDLGPEETRGKGTQQDALDAKVETYTGTLTKEKYYEQLWDALPYDQRVALREPKGFDWGDNPVVNVGSAVVEFLGDSDGSVRVDNVTYPREALEQMPADWGTTQTPQGPSTPQWEEQAASWLVDKLEDYEWTYRTVGDESRLGWWRRQ